MGKNSFYDDEKLNLFCQELARLILGEDDFDVACGRMCVLDETVHSAWELYVSENGGE
jgi:hypothetical protein